MERLGRSDGVRLMRLWGLPDWPDVEADYMLWESCCVFAIIPLGIGVQLHMAMMKDSRKHCRYAVSDVLGVIGDKPIVAPILKGKKSVENLAVKFGFSASGEQDTDQGRVKCYIRGPSWAV